MGARSSILAWKIPWTEEPGGLQSTGSKRDTNEQLSTLMETVRSWEGVAGRSEGGRASPRM